MAKDKASEEPTTEPAADITEQLVTVITTDEFSGQGGSYTYDPSTNSRILNKES